MNIANPFRNAQKRAAFAECIRSYKANKGGICRGGLRCGNSASTEFWRGYDSHRFGWGCPYQTQADMELMGYVFWRAGQAVARSKVTA
jgi:hypothetical protein